MAEQRTRKFDMSNDSNTTQRDQLARIAVDAMFPPVSGLPDDPMTWPSSTFKTADAILAKYILIPRPTYGEAQRGNSQIILIDGIGVTSDAVWLRSKLATEEMAMEACAHRSERIRSALAYLETEAAAQAETKLQGRRDELTHALIMDGKVKLGAPWTYSGASPLLQRAVDRIIELEAAAEATK
jgi:hypothetical protein